jgi:hypothetical protein
MTETIYQILDRIEGAEEIAVPANDRRWTSSAPSIATPTYPCHAGFAQQSKQRLTHIPSLPSPRRLDRIVGLGGDWKSQLSAAEW